MTTTSPPSANLRAEMARAGLLQIDIAQLLGMSQPQISQRLAGDIPWRVTELQAIARHLKVPVAALIDDDPAASPVAEPAAS